MNGSHCWPTGLLFNQDRSGLIRILDSIWQVLKGKPSMMQKNVKLFPSYCYGVGHFSCLRMAHIAGPPVSCSIRIGRVWLNIGIQLDKFYITCLIFWSRSQSTTFYLLWLTCGNHLHSTIKCSYNASKGRWRLTLSYVMLRNSSRLVSYLLFSS